MEEDEDDFIYGPSTGEPSADPHSVPVLEPQPVWHIQHLDEVEGVGEHDTSSEPPVVENGADGEHETEEKEAAEAEAEVGVEEEAEAEAEAEAEVEVEEVEEVEDEEDEESDIEIIVDAEERNKAMQRDFRPSGTSRTSFGAGTPPPGSRPPHLTTEYTPTPRGEIPVKAPPPLVQKAPTENEKEGLTPVQDPLKLPPATAPPSHPPINPSEPGVIDGRSIFEVDMDALAEKPWRRPGSDLSDYFNYGFDEISWEAYCYRRRELGEMADHLKGVVTNFSGMPEEQIAALPPEVRAMVMTGATSLMSGGALPHGGPPMMGVGVGGPGPMMHDMGMMGVMNGGDVQAMQAAGMMHGGVPDGEVMSMQGMQQDGFQPGGPLPGPGQMMGLGQEYGMQDPGTMSMYPQSIEGGGTPGQGSTPIQTQGPGSSALPASGHSPVPGPGTGSVNVPTGPAAARNPPAGPQAAFRGRGAPVMSMGMRGRGGFGRGRGRGGMYMPDSAPQPTPIRPASPLPPNVPTGPRNQNRYKDRDGNAPAVEGLDYGGGMQGSTDVDDRSGRKRRGSPSQEDGRSLKRR